MMNVTTNSLDASGLPVLSPVELRVLGACHEVTVRQRELVPLLAVSLHISDEDMFYTWAARRCRQSGRVEGTDWKFFFHGLECDLKNTTDGRFLRIDFGPGGRLDTFTAWGVLQFIMTSTHPWPEYDDLKTQLAEAGPPFDQHSGSLAKLEPIWDHLAAQGIFEQAAPELVQLQANHTTVGPDGLKHTHFPPDVPEETRIDCTVAHRQKLSDLGRHILPRAEPAALDQETVQARAAIMAQMDALRQQLSAMPFSLTEIVRQIRDEEDARL